MGDPAEVLEDNVEEIQEEENKPDLPEGFQTREQWEESGKNPDDWRSPKTFEDFKSITEANKRLHQKVDHLTNSFEQRLKGVSTMHQAQLRTQAEELNAQKKEAIEDADVDKVNQIDQQLNGINQQQSELNQGQQNELQQVAKYFNDFENYYTANFPDKALDIKDKLNGVLARHTDPNQAAAELDAYVKTLTPSTNPRRSEPNKTISSTSKTKGKVTMSDVTPEEMEQKKWFKDDKTFLQAVKDSRTYGEKK